MVAGSTGDIAVQYYLQFVCCGGFVIHHICVAKLSGAGERKASRAGWPRSVELTARPGTAINAYKTFVTNTEKNRLLTNLGKL